MHVRALRASDAHVRSVCASGIAPDSQSIAEHLFLLLVGHMYG